MIPVPMTIVDALKYYLYDAGDYRIDNPQFDLDYIFTTRDEVEMVKTCMIDYSQDVIHLDNGIVINFTYQNNVYQLEFIIVNHSQSVGDYGNYEAYATLSILAKLK